MDFGIIGDFMIRKFKEEDINSIMEIWLNENIKVHNFIPEEYWKNNYEYVKEILPNSEIYVYTDKNKIKGFIGIKENYIEGIFVDNESKCKGVGTALLNKAKENRDTLKLNVYKKNNRAINFYIKNKFTISEENVDKDTGEKEYLMKWKK